MRSSHDHDPKCSSCGQPLSMDYSTCHTCANRGYIGQAHSFATPCEVCGPPNFRQYERTHVRVRPYCQYQVVIKATIDLPTGEWNIGEARRELQKLKKDDPDSLLRFLSGVERVSLRRDEQY